VPNILQFGNENKATETSLLFYQLQITNSPLILPVLSLPTVERINVFAARAFYLYETAAFCQQFAAKFAA